MNHEKGPTRVPLQWTKPGEVPFLHFKYINTFAVPWCLTAYSWCPFYFFQPLPLKHPEHTTAHQTFEWVIQRYLGCRGALDQTVACDLKYSNYNIIERNLTLGGKMDVYYLNNIMITASKYEFVENVTAENVNEQVKYFFHSNPRLPLPSHALWIW